MHFTRDPPGKRRVTFASRQAVLVNPTGFSFTRATNSRFHPADRLRMTGMIDAGTKTLHLRAGSIEHFQGSCKLWVPHPCGVLVFAARVGSHDAYITATVKKL
jgi:hypothetical protein